MPHGYNGKILHVNLTSGELSVEEPDEAFYRKYMGGSAIAMHYILKEMPAGVDPLGSNYVLVLALSLLTGSAISGQSRVTAAAKSPLGERSRVKPRRPSKRSWTTTRLKCCKSGLREKGVCALPASSVCPIARMGAPVWVP
jgi:hypothetical protein